MVWGLVLNLTDFTCPDEFASIFVQESLILTLVAEGNWIRILKKKKINWEVPFILAPVVVSDKQTLVAGESSWSQWSFLFTSSLGVLAESVVFNFFFFLLEYLDSEKEVRNLWSYVNRMKKVCDF